MCLHVEHEWCHQVEGNIIWDVYFLGNFLHRFLLGPQLINSIAFEGNQAHRNLIITMRFKISSTNNSIKKKNKPHNVVSELILEVKQKFLWANCHKY